jgi:osmotically-inducible protein OsmY
MKNSKDLPKNPISVPVNNWQLQNDTSLATTVSNAFKRNANFEHAAIEIAVSNAVVTLSGRVKWNYQREDAKSLAGSIIGVKGVTNDILINIEEHVKVNEATIRRALQTNVRIDASDITIEVSATQVVLKGIVDSWLEKELAERIVWKAPGVTNVENQLTVRYERD